MTMSNSQVACWRESAWQRAFNSGSNQAMITLTGLYCATFSFVLHDFNYYFVNFLPYSKDGTITPVQKIGRGKG